MTIAPAAPAPAPTVPAGQPGEPARRRSRWQWPVAVGTAVTLAALVTALGLPRGNDAWLDPTNPRPNGARALAQVLSGHGVTVHRANRTAEAVGASGPGSTLLVTRPELLGDDQLAQVDGSGADLVLVEPDLVTLRALVPLVEPAGLAPARAAGPGCGDPDATAAGEVLAGGHLYRARIQGTGTGPVICYPPAGRPGAGALAVGSGPQRRVTVIGQSALLTNERLARDGNAALALRLLGHRDRLVWYLPDPLELGAQRSARTLAELAPRWLPWVVAQLALAVLVTMAWRARRLGRLVPEPLPVLVRAAETQEGRARLYRQSRARGRVAATLRTAALRRIAARLTAPAGTGPDEVCALAAERTGRAPGPLRELLLGTAPADDTALVRLADDLDALQNEIAAGPRSGTGRPTGRIPAP